jgi:hypothetical protein
LKMFARTALFARERRKRQRRLVAAALRGAKF